MGVVTDTTTSWDIQGDTEWQAWVQAVHDAISGAGLIQTADTGQIDPATTTRPSTEQTSLTNAEGYEIWRFNDSEQGANPVYFKIGYGQGDASSFARLFFQVGRGSDGAGNLIDPSASTSTSSNSAGDGVDRIIHACFEDNAFLLFASPNGGGTVVSFVLAIERLKNPEGAFTSEILALGNSDGGSDSWFIDDIWDGAWNATNVYVPFFDEDLTPDAATPIFAFWTQPSSGHNRLRTLFLTTDSTFTIGDTGTAHFITEYDPAGVDIPLRIAATGAHIASVGQTGDKRSLDITSRTYPTGFLLVRNG